MRSPTMNDSHLLRMPNEILHLCFEQVAYLDRELAIGYEYYNIRYKNANTDSKEHTRTELHQGQINVEGQYALALTCRRFHDLIIPILYTTVRLDAHEFCQDWSHQRVLFFRTIDNDPSLKLHIKDLTINWDFECVGSDTIRYLTKLPNLERLALWKMKVEPGMMAGPLPEEKGTSSLIDISFKALHAKPADIKPLLEWPRNLQCFDFGHMSFDAYDLDEPEAEFNYAKFIDALEPQRESLRVLKIGYLPYYNTELHKLSTRLFPQLHTLTLNLMEKHPSPITLHNWIGPSLHTLILDFHGDSQCGPFSTFAAVETQKMMRVGRWARKTKECGGGENLKRIGIRVFVDDSEEIGDVIGEERQCEHKNRSKKLLAMALKSLERHGFRSFWIGASGVEHTHQDIRGFCECDDEAWVTKEALLRLRASG